MTKVKKRRIKVGKLIICLLILLLSFYLIFSLFKFIFSKIIVKTEQGFVAATSETIKLYNLEFNEVKDLVRGTEITIYEKDIKNEQKT